MPCSSQISAPGHKFWSNAPVLPGDEGMVALGIERHISSDGLPTVSYNDSIVFNQKKIVSFICIFYKFRQCQCMYNVSRLSEHSLSTW